MAATEWRLAAIRLVRPASQRRRPRFRTIDRCGAAFVLLSLLFGLIFVFITPPLWGFDESAHFGRVYQIDHGQILPKRIPDTRGIAYGGEVPINANALVNYATADYHKPPRPPAPRVTNPGEYQRLQSQPLASPLVDQWFTNTAAYSPVPYVPAVVGLRIAEISHGSVGFAVRSMRICSLLAYTLIVWLALRALREHRFKWVVFAAALLPLAVFQAATITADTMTNALAILFSALFVKATFLRDSLSRGQTALLFAAAVLLPVTKPAYLILALLLPVVPSAQLAIRRGSRIVQGCVTVLSVAAFGVWTFLSAGTSSGMGLMRPKPQWHSVVASEQLHYVLTHIPHFLRICLQTILYQGNRYFDQFFGELGFSYIKIPAIAVICCIVAGIIAFGMCGRPHASHPRLIVVIAALVLSIVGIFGALYLEFSPVGYYFIDGVQGRYFLPLILVTAAILLQLIPLRLHVGKGRVAMNSRAAIVLLLGFALATSVVKYDYLIWH
ncbi:MAG: DUF2142 domain-containing protein [Sciscionella sp.]